MEDRPVVIVVEDDVEMNDLERQFLDLYGLRSLPAYTGPEALEVCGDCHPDAVLLDLMLPEMDGFETCRRLRQCGNGSRRMPIVIVTALDTDDCRRRGFEAGADAYFSKPFDPDEVAQTLRILIERSGEDGAIDED